MGRKLLKRIKIKERKSRREKSNGTKTNKSVKSMYLQQSHVRRFGKIYFVTKFSATSFVSEH